MLNRLRRAWWAIRFVAGLAVTWAADALGPTEVLTLIGLVLIGGGLWSLSRAAALIVPGIILLWIVMPSRPPFVERPPVSRRDVSR